MDTAFLANQKSAADPDFVYDLRADFGDVKGAEKVDCGWDSSSEEGD